MKLSELKVFLDEKVDKYNRVDFIENDPICIPHQFEKKPDIEISGLFAAVLAWGQRKTIINKCNELMDRMGGEPHRFVLESSDVDQKNLLGFKHRTFNDTDLLYFVDFLRAVYSQHKSLEDAFVSGQLDGDHTGPALQNFYERFVTGEHFPMRTAKHIQSPLRKSACKRMSMFLRWMVRRDDRGVDFGLWSKISSSQLICPCDLHVDRVARRLKLISRKQTDWLTALELTNKLKKLNPQDPVLYDFALFGLGIEEKF